MSAAAVDVRGFGFRPTGRTTWTPRDVSFSVAAGERILVLGNSGSGKSTLLSALANVLTASGERDGSISIAGHTPAAARDRVGLLMQDPDAFLILDQVEDDVAFGPQNQGLPPDAVQQRTRRALDTVGFPYPLNHKVDALSGGERQRVALAGVLALAPDLLLLDEPTSQLDPDGSKLIRDAVANAVSSRDTTLIVVEHRVDEWLPLVDRVFILSDDGTLAAGTPLELKGSAVAAGSWLDPPSPPQILPTARSDVMLRARDVSYTYKGQSQSALKSVDCDIPSHTVTAMTGPNGCGKSTLARTLGGLYKPTQGSVTATTRLSADVGTQKNGSSDVSSWTSRQLAGRIGSVFQNPEHSFLTDAVLPEVMLGPLALGRPKDAVRNSCMQLLTVLRLDHLCDANPFTLSGGEQRRLSVAAALSTSPQVLILDEPTFGQDPRTWRELVNLIAAERDRGRAVVVVSHDAAFVSTVSDHTFQMK